MRKPGPLLNPTHAGLIRLATTGLTSPHTSRSYASAIARYLAYLATTPDPTNITRHSVQSYLDHCRSLPRPLSASTLNLHLSAIRRLTSELVAHGAAPDSLHRSVSSIKSIPNRGVRAGNWLTKEEAQLLLDSTGPATLDRVIIAILLGCGLRRAELRNLTHTHIQQREGRWCIVDIIGKGGRVRTIPMPSWCKAIIDEYLAGPELKSVPDQRLDLPQDSIMLCPYTETTIYNIVRRLSVAAGLRPITPHDLRRTFSKLARKGGAALEQIQLSLGHESVQTTQRYLGTEIDYASAPCDALGIERPQSSDKDVEIE